MYLIQKGLFNTHQYEITADKLLVTTNGYTKSESKQIPYEQVLVEERFVKNQVNSSLVALTILVGILISLLILTQFHVYTMMDLLVVIGGLSVISIIGIRFLKSSATAHIILPLGNNGYIELQANKPSSGQVDIFINSLNQKVTEYLRANYAVIGSDKSLDDQLADYSWLHGRKMISQEEYFQLTTDARKML